MKKRRKRRTLSARGKIRAAEVRHRGNAGSIGDDGAVTQLQGEWIPTVRPMPHGLPMAADDGYRFVLHEKVLFDSGSATLTEKGSAALANVAEALQGGTDPIHIEGHTDDVPVAKAETLEKFPRGNIELSVMRALAVWDYLVKQGGVSETRLTVAGFGPHRPRVPNSSQQNRWRNRRVEIRIATAE